MLLKSFSIMQKVKSISYSLVSAAAGYTLACKRDVILKTGLESLICVCFLLVAALLSCMTFY